MEERERREGGGEEEAGRNHDPHPRQDKDWVCAAMLGSLGLFGNGLIQLAASIALAESQGLALAVPQRWHQRFGALFVGGGAGAGNGADGAKAPADANATPTSYRWRPIPDAEARALPIVSDRVVLSHAGFRVWMATREPYLSLVAEGGGGNGGALSGRQLRRLFPQAAVADVAEGGARPEGAPPPAPLAGRGLWGWFQWPTAALARHAPLLLGVGGEDDDGDGGDGGAAGPLRLRPELARALDAAVDALVDCYCKPKSTARRRRRPKVVAVHLRRGDCAGRVCPEKGHSTTAAGGGGGGSEQEGGPQAPPPLRTEPPFELGTGEAWDDQGLCWRTPVEWLRPGLERAVAEVGREEEGEGGGDDDDDNGSSSRPLVVLCTDDPHLAREPSAVWPGAATWAAAADCVASAAAVEAARGALQRARHQGGGGEGEDIKDDDDLHMLLDWRLMQRHADALLISNSTFSFTAAWLSSAPKPPRDGDRDGAPGRLFFRPCPQACAFVPFDPWDSLCLLPSRANLPANHGAHRFREKQQQELG